MKSISSTKWRSHLQEEVDAAFYYRFLAEHEPEKERKEIYQRIASTEDKHARMLDKMPASQEHSIHSTHPSFKARFFVWIARRFGSSYLLSMMLHQEGQEVKNYLSLFKSSRGETEKGIAHTLAKESAEHSFALGQILGENEEPWHQTKSGGFLRNIIYGFNDGLTANFGLFAGVIGASVEPHVVLLSGFAGMLADSLSMGSSGYLAAKSEQEVNLHEIEMEKEEMLLMPEEEEDELSLIYEMKGIEQNRARQMAKEIMNDPHHALQEKVREELGILAAHTTPLKEGLVTGTATAIGAFVPIAPFLIFSTGIAIWISFIISMLTHFGVGAARSIFTGRSIFRSGLDMFLVGLGIAVAGYFLGELLITILH